MLEQRSRELGRLIGQSAEYQALKRSSAALMEDREAAESLRRMEELKLEVQRQLAQGREPTPEMEQELEDLLGKVQVLDAYQRAISAQENFDKVMMQVNSWIMDGIKTGAQSSILIV